jgi:L-asparaginase / beta-aspartyl-peptidase
MPDTRPVLIVHGGAGIRQPELDAAQRAGCAAALAAGWQVLVAGGSALDAVCAAVMVLEDDPAFSAGVGSSLTTRGSVEMDASAMDGHGWRAGAVAVVRAVRHAVQLARTVMEDGRHVFLAGPDADEFARLHGVEMCRPETLITARQLERWQQGRAGGSTGTVGAAAVDRAGHVAAATSTGGTFLKLPGRIGDSAVIGAGTYADDALGAASATGQGETIIRVGLARSVVDALRDGCDPARAAQLGIRELERRVGGQGGIIVVDALGRCGAAHNTPHMTFGSMHADLSGPAVQV